MQDKVKLHELCAWVGFNCISFFYILSEYCVVTLRQRAKWKINEKLIMVQYLQQFLYQGERLLDEQGWREEAKGVIKEIVNFVKVLTVSDQLK